MHTETGVRWTELLTAKTDTGRRFLRGVNRSPVWFLKLEPDGFSLQLSRSSSAS